MYKLFTAAILATTLFVSGAYSHEIIEQDVTTLTDEIGGSFSLTDQNGNIVTNETLKGSPYAIFFGFTSCPDVCPTTLAELTVLKEKLGSKADDLKVVFVTLDPEFDKPEMLKQYLSGFDNSFLGLSGSQAQIDHVVNEFYVIYEKITTDYGYTISHTATTYLIDEDGNLFDTIQYREDSNSALEKLKRLLK